MKTIKVSIPVRVFLQNAYFSPYCVRVAAQRIFHEYDTYKDLYVHSVDIFNRNGNTSFNINFSNHHATPPICTVFMFKAGFSLSDYDFRCLRNYFKHLSTYGND